MRHQLAHFLRGAMWPAAAHAGRGQCTQMAARRFTCGHQLVRVGVMQLIQGEAATRGNAQRFIEQRARIDPGKTMARTQIALAVGKQTRTDAGDGGTRAYRKQRIQ